MNFLRKVGDAVGDALIGSESESESETDSEFERGIDEPGRTEESRSSTGENVDSVHGNREVEADKANEEFDELVHSAMDFGRSTFEKLKHVSRGVETRRETSTRGHRRRADARANRRRERIFQRKRTKNDRRRSTGRRRRRIGRRYR